jgi:porphobilinogen synthase
VPTFAYQISGSAMLKAAAQNGWLDHDAVMMENAQRTSARVPTRVLTYFAKRCDTLASKAIASFA